MRERRENKEGGEEGGRGRREEGEGEGGRRRREGEKIDEGCGTVLCALRCFTIRKCRA